MPVYGSRIPNASVGRGVAQTVWSADTPTPGNGTTAASEALGMVAKTSGNTPFSVDGKFSGAPGAFEIDVQVAATDSDTQYSTIANGNITTVDSTNNGFHFDAPFCNGRFVRLLLRSRTNSVSITATITGG